MSGRRLASWALWTLAVSLLPAAARAASVPELVGAGMELTYAGDYEAADAIWARLRALDPTHPAGPGQAVSTLYWRHMYDDEDTRWDAAIEAGAREALRLAEARLARDPDDAEAHYYAGQALMHLGRLEGFRGRYLAAGRHGEKGRVHLERALALAPDFVDARYPLGLYLYYTDFVSRWVRWLSFLPFVPRGDGPQGRRYLEEVARSGEVHRDNARFILSNILTYHDPKDPARALELLRDLHARRPRNTLVHFELLETLGELGDWRSLVEEARRLEAQPGESPLDRGRRDMARVWRAHAELRLGRPDLAQRALAVFGPGEPAQPLWGSAWVYLVRGRAYDVVGQRERAVAEYRAVLAIREPRGSSRARARARRNLREPFQAPVAPSLIAAP